jgi:hypothetical protein
MSTPATGHMRLVMVGVIKTARGRFISSIEPTPAAFF